MPEAPAPTQGGIKSLVKVVRFLGKYPIEVALCFALLLVNMTIEMSLPQLLGNGINVLQRSLDTGRSFSLRPHILLFFSLVTIRALVGILLGPIRNRLVQKTLGDIRLSVFNAIQFQPFAYHNRMNSGELISRATTDIWRLQDFFYACLFLSLDIAAALISILFLISAIHWQLGLATIATLLPTLFLVAFYAAKLQPRWREVHDLHGGMSTVVQENIAGVRVVKAFGGENGQISKFSTANDGYLKALLGTVNYWASRVSFAQFFFGLGMPLILWLGGRMVIRHQLMVGDLAKAIFYLMAIGNRVGVIGQFTNIVQTANASAERIMEIMEEPQTLIQGALKKEPIEGRVRFQNVRFRFGTTGWALNDVSFEASPGETIALVGPTGAGKSALASLIPRFYDPQEGRVLVDEHDVKQFDLHSLRRQIGFVFQESFLFSTTVKENIAVGRPGADDDEVRRAAIAANADEFIQALENGYETVIGERGVSLSGGQRQRIALARAFLLNPPILILDDATSSVDAATEHLIQDAMKRLTRDRTTFIIAHRCSTVRHAHQILVLENGRIVQSGDHESLLKAGGYYEEIHRHQSDEGVLV